MCVDSLRARSLQRLELLAKLAAVQEGKASCACQLKSKVKKNNRYEVCLLFVVVDFFSQLYILTNEGGQLYFLLIFISAHADDLSTSGKRTLLSFFSSSQKI